MGNFNFEEYRQPWETGPHWELKREFLERYQDHFHVDRLLCLAQAYSNIELLHCSYPLEVMQEIRQLSQPLQGCKRFRNISVEQKNETIKGKRKSNDLETPKKYKFIKFCSSNDSPVMDQKQSKNISKMNVGIQVDYTSIAQSPDLENIQILASEVKKQLPVKRKKSFELIESSVQSLDMQNVFHLNFKHDSETTNKKCYCELHIGTTLLSVGDGNNQNNAKIQAARYALPFLGNLESLLAKNIKQVQEVSKIETRNSDSALEKTKSNQDKNTPQKVFSRTKCSKVLQENKQVQPEFRFLKEFAKKLRSLKENSKQSAFVLINETGKCLNVSDSLVFNIVLDLNSPVCKRIFMCEFLLKNVSISQGKGTSKKRAKNQAAEIGFDYLLKLLEQSKNKCSYSDSDKIKQTFIEETVKGENQIGNCNISNVEKLAFFKPSSNSLVSKIESEINISVETNNLDNKISSSFNKLSDTSDSKQFMAIKNVAEELSAKYFAINEKLLANSYKQQFVLFDPTLVAGVDHQSPGEILNFSMAQCRKQFSFNIEAIQPTGTIKADLVIDKNIIATGIGSNKVEAKLEAKQSALEKLRKEVYTVKVKLFDENGYVISRENIFDSISHKSQAVSEDNIGCKMLKKMGWTGGGIGKTEGIVEPIIANDHSFGKGLGYVKQGISKEKKMNSTGFKLKIDTLLFDYSESKETRPLIFSSDFSKAERKEIHMIAKKYNNLLSNSYGKGEARQLNIKRKISVTELLNSILKAGGSTYKYELVDLST